jgi:LacI family transcriptional regulator
MNGRMDKERDTGEKAARLIDVAKLADVSRATAARALGGYGLVTDATRERVAAAATALNYRVNELARSMRSGRTLTIGVIVADITNSFFNSAIRAIIDTAATAGYQILVLNTDDDIRREREALKVLLEKRVDGLIVVPASPKDSDHLLARGEPDVPIVLLDRYIDSTGIDFVTTDDFEAARDAIHLLVGRGHRRIGMLIATAAATGHSNRQPKGVVTTVSNRVDGAVAALKERGIPFNRDWHRYSRTGLDVAKDAAVHILQTSPRPTAVLATNEEMALGFVAACTELDLSIGHDVSLISFDDTPWASVFRPALSVVQRPVYALGQAAVTVLLSKIAGDKTVQSIKLPAVLIDRNSIGPARS